MEAEDGILNVRVNRVDQPSRPVDFRDEAIPGFTQVQAAMKRFYLTTAVTLAWFFTNQGLVAVQGYSSVHAASITEFLPITTGLFDDPELPGFTTYAMRVTTDETDWTNADLSIELTSGTLNHIPEELFGSPNQANGLGDTATIAPTRVLGDLTGGFHGTVGYAGTHVETLTSFKSSWFTTETDDIGTFDIAMITISNDANGSLAYRSFSGYKHEDGPGGPGQLTIDFNIIDGKFVAVEPLSIPISTPLPTTDPEVVPPVVEPEVLLEVKPDLVTTTDPGLPEDGEEVVDDFSMLVDVREDHQADVQETNMQVLMNEPLEHTEIEVNSKDLIFVRGIPVLPDRIYPVLPDRIDWYWYATDWLSTGITNDLVRFSTLSSTGIERRLGVVVSFTDVPADSMAVPEPGTLILAGFSLLGWFGFRRRQR